MIAMALVNDPDLLIADEPTTALDVTVQAQILDLLEDLQREFNSAIILITHDLGVVGQVADDVLVMYGGRAVEKGTVEQVLRRPQHPYTWGLLASVPSLHGDADEDLVPIKGNPPSLINLPTRLRVPPALPLRRPQRRPVAHEVPELPRCSEPATWSPVTCPRRTARSSTPRTSHRRWGRAMTETWSRSPAGAGRAVPPVRRAAAEGRGPDQALPGAAAAVRQDRLVRAVDGVDFAVDAGRDPRSGGRVRLRQDHDRPDAGAAAGADRGQDRLRGQGHQPRARAAGCARCGRTCRSSSRTRTRR